MLVRVILPSLMPLKEQMQRFRSAHIAVGVDGSATISAATQLCDGMGLVIIGRESRNAKGSGKYTMHLQYLNMFSNHAMLHVKFLHSYVDAPNNAENATHVLTKDLVGAIGDLKMRVGQPALPCGERLRFFLDYNPNHSHNEVRNVSRSTSQNVTQRGLFLKSVDRGKVVTHALVEDLESDQFSSFSAYIKQIQVRNLPTWKCAA